MKYATVCSGVEAFTVGCKKLPDWKPVWFSEIEPFPCQVLQYHYPDVPNLGDMTKLSSNRLYVRSTFDVLAGGTPCQSFSIAGLRGGLDDERGNLALEYCRILIEKQPSWFLWENVPGVFSSFTDDKESKVYARDRTNTGYFGFETSTDGSDSNNEDGTDTIQGYDCTQSADFARLLQAFRECGYSVCYRVLDSQYFGVPQRRRCVFVVGYRGNDWRPPFAVLFERESLYRDYTPGRPQGEGTAQDAAADPEISGGTVSKTKGTKQRSGKSNKGRGRGRRRPDDGDRDGYGQSGTRVDPVVFDLTQITNVNNRSNPKNGDPTPTICKGNAHNIASVMWWDGGQTAQTLDRVLSKGQTMPDKNRFPAVLVPVQMQSFQYKASIANTMPVEEVSQPIGATKVPALFSQCSLVRRLTPLECERLQGFPDNYTNIPGASDTVRYQAIGNSMTTHVIEWLCNRIDKVDKLLKKLQKIDIK